MRVTRRVRPAQVGCGATIGRRRLYAACMSSVEERNEVPQAPRIALVIQPNGQIVPAADDPGLRQSADTRSYEPMPELVGSSNRGL